MDLSFSFSLLVWISDALELSSLFSHLFIGLRLWILAAEIILFPGCCTTLLQILKRPSANTRASTSSHQK
jgi:hypothetical protein